uniref:Uncharacterized protein n=1 Tax=viral metagenome TaxID=1070528 RepID=A0A6C0E700_9ZZZZ
MVLKTFIVDIIRLVCLIILDHLRSVPRKSNIKLLRLYWNIYMNKYWNKNKNFHRNLTDLHEKKFYKFKREELLELYHKMALVIWKLYWLSPSLIFVKYTIDFYQYRINDCIVSTMVPYIQNMQFHSLNHVYFFTFRNVLCSNNNQKERALKVLDVLYNQFDYPNASLTFIMDSSKVIEELKLSEEFPESLFDTTDLKNFTKYHKTKSTLLINENHPKKIYCNDDIPGSFITYLTFNWIFQKLVQKFNTHLFYMEEGSFNHFDQRMNENYADPGEIIRWAQLKSSFRTFKIDDSPLKYYTYSGGNIYKCTEKCLEDQANYMFSLGSKHTLNFLESNQAVQLPCIVFPSKGCLKGSREDTVYFNLLPLYKRIFKMIKHNISLLIFIYIDMKA